MFYAEAILSKKGPLAKVWLAAHLERKLTKTQLLQASIPSSVGAIIGQDQGPPLALRLSGQLLLGVVRIYARKARYLLEDCNEALIRIKMAFRPGAADITSDAMVAAHNAITLPEALTEFDILLPFPARLHGVGLNEVGSATDGTLELEMAAAAMNTSRIQDITLAEQSFDISMIARGGEGAAGADLGDEYLLGRDDDFRLDLDDDFVFSPGPQQLPEPSIRLDESAMEPETGREAMQGLDESIAGAHAEDISLLAKGMRGLHADGSMMDIAHEELGDGVGGGDVLRFGGGDDLAMHSVLGDISMVPDTQEAALQEAEAEVLAAARAHPARPGKRRRLNLSQLVASEATSLSPDEIRRRLNDPTDIVRMPTYLPLSSAARLEEAGSAAAASRFLMADHDTPFASLFAVEDFGAEQEVPTAAGFGDQDEDGFGANGEAIDTEYMLGGDDYRIEDGGEDIGFGADPGLVDQPLYADELLLAEKSAEQLERLEEESFQRQAENQAHGGAGLFTAALPASDDDISLHVSQFAEPETLEAGSAEDALQGGQEGAQSSSAGYSKNTIRAIHILDAACTSENVPVADSVLTSKDGGPLLSYQSVVRDAHRSDAVKLFFELLVLKSKDFIDVKQSAPFEDIMIAPCAKLRSAADSISVSGAPVSTTTISINA
ncbi:sister chromatid cohesion protein 1 [Coemansia thaxteri]|uniref:Sister chromatid cohesion protein 1 n=1 Tax=Coemansia thaxteri TaxID=2663907 RepID=A0A9W8BIJ3_9FUNG|nr:sister chromatid cohesion protein 1 [Coemansia thaxteri]